jgi:ligand-binding sensor domain-containing protein/signal transduction histidine kinase
MKKALLLLALIIALQYSYAQPAHLSFDHLSIKEGMPDNSINDIIQDNQGYIWLTTFNGVVRYDGYRIKVYKPGMGDKGNVPNSLFNGILQDKHHDIWVNSWNNGLFKYDRRADHFVQYKNKSRDNKGFQFTAGIDSTGKIWSFIIATSGFQATGLQQFDPATGIFKRYGNNQKGGRYLNCKLITYLYIDHKGKVWLGADNGFYLYHPSSDSFTGYLTAVDTLKRNTIQMMYEAQSTPGKLWACVINKKDKHPYLLRIDVQSGQTEKFEHLAADKNSPGNDTVNTAFEDKKHRLWLGTAAGISLYNEKTKTFTNYRPIDTIKIPGKNNITHMTADKDDNLWIVSGYGLLCFNPGTAVFKRYTHDKDDPASINSNQIISMLFDREGTLWIGLNNNGNGGADRVNAVKSAFQPLKGNGRKFPWHDINAMAYAPDGGLWIGAQNGLYRYDKISAAVKFIAPEIVTAVFAAKNGVVYFGANNKSGNGDGLRVYDPKTGKTAQYKTNPKDTASLSNNFIGFIMEDHTGTIWIATQGGGICAFYPHTKKIKRYPYINNNFTKTSHNMLDDGFPGCIYEDNAGILWVGTVYGGLNHFDRKRNIFISSFMPQDGLSTVTSIKQDSKGRLWAGSFINGLFLVDSHTGTPIKRFTTKDGLLIDQVLFIHADQSNYVWLGGKGGFTRINTNDFSLKNYTAAGNDLEYVFDEGNLNFLDAGGHIIASGSDNIASFDPNAITKDANPPLVHIENVAYSDPRAAKDSFVSIETFGRSQKELPWNQNKITFNYVALHYINAAQNRYAYQLSGFDKHWVQAGTQRSVTYTNLSPGTYTFHVKAANSDGIWNNKGDSFTIIINPPWWQTWWAWALWIVLFASAVYAFIAYRSRKLLEDKRVLEETVQVRTAEVMEQKEEIMQQKEEIEAQAANALKQASVDRIRAEIASMRSTNDLEKITPLIWKELTVLDVPFIRCGVFIVDEQEEQIHTYLSTPDGKALAAYPIPFNTEGIGQNVLLNWRSKQIFTDHWDEAQFIEYSKNLVEQGAVESEEKYLTAHPPAGLYLHFFPFLQGMLYVGNTAPLIDNDMNLVQILADAFAAAYARYEDFNKLEAAKQQVDNTLANLQAAQTQLIQSEKMASLGELTAGIAHEIQNPLNFVNNFSEVNQEMLAELKTEIKNGNTGEALTITADIIQNEEKILYHGKRADSIVKGMLEHSRSGSAQKGPTDINVMADEYMRLSYHGLRAKDKSFNAGMTTHFDAKLPKINVVQQDIGRILLNLFNNAFYAVHQKHKTTGNDYKPEVTVTTSAENGHVIIQVKDNGAGIPAAIKDKIMQPFFTTKPTGEGTGLGLSLTYDMVVKGHGGNIKVNSVEGEGSEFIISLPIG